ncbi:DUF4352 domain-containing protein [Actinoplanes sp. CA-030573]|uniref:DUF4352 domain-containing protein n=1 Tax=Actinoplanes sp. CA-030573 TaxID=3239898 RepID=UPI003D8C302E
MSSKPLRPAAADELEPTSPDARAPRETGTRGDEVSLPGSGGRRRGKWIWVLAGGLAVVAAGSGAYAVGGSGDRGVAVPAASASGSAAPGTKGAERGVEDATLNRTGADGAFIVTVTGLRCGVSTVGAGELRQRAKGQFCLVSVNVENAGREARLLDSGAQRALDVHGREYSLDDHAAAILSERSLEDGSATLLDEVPAGATVSGVLPFDVPAGTRLSALLVHETAGSRGARIALS